MFHDIPFVLHWTLHFGRYGLDSAHCVRSIYSRLLDTSVSVSVHTAEKTNILVDGSVEILQYKQRK